MEEEKEVSNVVKQTSTKEIITTNNILKNALAYLPLMVILLLILGIIKQLLFYRNFNLPIHYFLNTSEIVLLISDDLFFMTIVFIVVFIISYRLKKYTDKVILSTEQEFLTIKDKIAEVKNSVVKLYKSSLDLKKTNLGVKQELSELEKEYSELEKKDVKYEQDAKRLFEISDRIWTIKSINSKSSLSVDELKLDIDKTASESEKLESKYKSFKLKMKLMMVLLLLSFIILSIIYGGLTMLFTFTKLYYLELILLPLISLPIFIFLPKFFKDLISKYFEQNVYIALFTFIFLISVVMIKAGYDIFLIEKGKYSGTTITTSDTSQPYISNDTAFFIGKTDRYIFFYNKKQQSTTIIPTDQITKMVIKSK